MKTAKERVDATCYIWALPKTDWELSNEIDEVDGDMTKVMPFRYAVTTSSSHWRDDAVQVHEFPVTGYVPEGVDLVRAAVDTLRAEILKVKEEAQKKVDELQQRIDKLALIEYKPDGWK